MTSEDPIRHLCRDRRLARIIERVGEYKIRTTRNRYESLVEGIITQQLSGSAAGAISERFRSLYGAGYPAPADVIRTPDSRLRKTGLSNMKVRYIKNLSEKIESGELRLRRLSRLSDEQVVGELTKIRGIGRWTAEMFLIFALGRLDVLPVGDLGLKKGIRLLRRMSRMPTVKEMTRTAERWRPYRTIATWYIWKGLQD